MSASSSFDVEAVTAELVGTQFAGRVNHLLSTASTNTLAIGAAQAGAAGGVWVADEQTAGRGRGGHGWHSVAGDGLYVSVLLRPRLTGADALKISLAAGLAAKRAASIGMGLKEHTPGAEARFIATPGRPEAQASGCLEAKAPTIREAWIPVIDLRWPNDLMVVARDGVERKFGGILTETAMSGGDGTLAYAVVGIGMNLNHVELPEELRAVATSLRMVTGKRVSRERVLVALLLGMEREMGILEGEAGGLDVGESIAVRFARASTWVMGAGVKVEEEDGYTGVTDGLDERGMLRVRLEDGSSRIVRHGGVRRV